MTAVADRRVVVTGKIPNESRITAQARLREAGAIVQEKVGKDTDILVTGDAVGKTKINAAKKLGVTIMSWSEAFGSGKASGEGAPPRAPMPSVRQWAPMLAKSDELPTQGNWLFEIKWDGIRGIATIENGNVTIQSRTGLSDLTNRYPDVTEELCGLPDCILDGELVPLAGDLAASLDCDADDDSVRFVAFDILEHGGQSLTSEPLNVRRMSLERVLDGGCYVAASPAFDDGNVLLDYVIEHGLEGVVAKQTHSKYVEDDRSGKWIKVKVRLEQEFVVLGYTAGEGARESTFGALILGYYEDGGMVYAGKVGTGFDKGKLGALVAAMTPLEINEPWTCVPRATRKDATWLLPEIVVQVAFQKWTEDRILWHPSYQRVREDKLAADVTGNA